MSSNVLMQELSHGGIAAATALIAVSVVAYTIWVAFYRLRYHPLACFPGPRLSALTYWYEFYFDVVKHGGGNYRWEIERMHEKYVTPNELHVDDPDWYEVLYASGNKVRDKYAPDAHMAGTTMGVFSTVDHQLHRQRKAALAPFFSRRAIHAEEPLLREKLALLCKALEAQARAFGVVDLHSAFLAFSTDFYCAFAIRKSPQPDLLPDLKWQFEFKKTIDAVENLTPVLKQMPGIISYATRIPSWVLRLVDPKMAKVAAMQEELRSIAETEIQLANETGGDDKNHGKLPSIFTTILNSKILGTEKTADRLLEEAFDHLSASGEPLSRVLIYSIFHLLSNPEKLSRLRAEVEELYGVKTNASLQDIEALPYLTAVIKESLRISAIVSSRLPLIAPDSVLGYKDWFIPAGTIVSMTPGQIMLDERCFTDASSFKPERWLGEEGLHLPPEKYFVPFSKGNRICSGIAMAQAQMSLVLAEVVRRYDMNLFETTRERDVDHARDCFLGKPHTSSKGVRITLKCREAE